MSNEVESVGMDPITLADHLAKKDRKDKAEQRASRRLELKGEIHRLEAEVTRLRQMPPDVEVLVDAWSNQIDSASAKFINDLKLNTGKGRFPELRIADKGAMAWLMGDRWKDELTRLACEVSGNGGANSRHAKAGSYVLTIVKLKHELAALG